MRATLFLVLGLWGATVSAQRLDASLQCRFTGTDFIYDCAIHVSRGGAPVEGARFTVSADMPSMPMAHSIRPVTAVQAGVPGEYHATLALDMPGEWAIKLRLSAPLRDQLVLHYVFDESGASPVRKRSSPRSDGTRRPGSAR